MTNLRITTLGSLRIERDGEEIRELPAQPVRCALLLYLALERSATRDELMALLWPERDSERARRSLNQTLYELRRQLGDGWLEPRGERVEVTPAVAVDALEFIAACEAERDEDALALYGGAFLAGCHPGETPAFEQWADRRRSHLARLHRDLCRRLTTARIDQGDAEGALALARRWAETDPLEDEAHHSIIELLAQTGRRTEALRHYEEYRELIARELEVEPLEQTRELVTRIRDRDGMPVEHAEQPAASPWAGAGEPPVPTAASGSVTGEAASPPTDRRESGQPLPRGRTARRPQGWLLGSLAAVLAVAMLLLWSGANHLPLAGSPGEDASRDARAIAVLPFVNLSPDPEQEYFSDGITEDLLTALSQIADLTVISRTSVMQYKGTVKSMRQIGEELGAAHVLEGSVRRAGNRVRVSAQLIDTRTDRHLWAETYDRELTDVFAIQSEIAQRIAGALRVRLTPAERQRLGRPPTSSLSAYDFYLQGRNYYLRFTRGENELAIELFRRALEADPAYALAYMGLADAYVQKTQRFNEPPAWADSAITAARQALSLDPVLADAHKALGVAYMVQGSYREALTALERAVELNPNLASAVGNLGLLYNRQGRFDEGLRWQRHALALQPAARAQQLSNIAAAYVGLGAFERAEQELRQALALQPDFVPPRVVRTHLALRQGTLAEAVELAEALDHDDPEDPGFRLAAGEAHLFLGDFSRAREHFEGAYARSPNGRIRPSGRDVRPLLAHALLKTGERERGLVLLRESVEQAHREIAGGNEAARDRYTLATAYALLGDRREAYCWLEEAVAAGWTDYLLLSQDAPFESLRGDEEFQRIVDRNRAVIQRQWARVEREGW